MGGVGVVAWGPGRQGSDEGAETMWERGDLNPVVKGLVRGAGTVWEGRQCCWGGEGEGGHTRGGQTEGQKGRSGWEGMGHGKG